MAHTISVPINIVPDDPEDQGMWPPVEDGTNYDMEDAAIAAAVRPAALAAEAALAGMDMHGWHVEIPPEQGGE